MTWHAHFASPGNDQADSLAKVQWLETVPTSMSGKVGQWLYCRLLHVGQKTTWSTMKAWGLPVTLAEVQEACDICVVCSLEHPWRPVGTTRQVVWGQIPLTQWQVDMVRPLHSSEGYKYAVTCVDMATGLLGAYLVHRPDQKVLIATLECLCPSSGQPFIIESDRRRTLQGPWCNNGPETCKLTESSM